MVLDARVGRTGWRWWLFCRVLRPGMTHVCGLRAWLGGGRWQWAGAVHTPCWWVRVRDGCSPSHATSPPICLSIPLLCIPHSLDYNCTTIITSPLSSNVMFTPRLHPQLRPLSNIFPRSSAYCTTPAPHPTPLPHPGLPPDHPAVPLPGGVAAGSSSDALPPLPHAGCCAARVGMGGG